ncbi:MAG: DUF3365 domain-containing protein [Nitrospinae bacterium]|nr:DUF3365 domain-containing protein [Nitrospinota bacterium]
MTNKFVSFVILLAFVLGLAVTPAWSSEDEAIANELTTLLKASRAVLVQNKPLIKNPQKAGIGVDKFLAITYSNYEKATGKKFKKGSGNIGKAQDQLIQAIKLVVEGVVSGKDTALDPQGRFLPAIFARKTATQFGQVTRGQMTLKLTTRDEYLVNVSNKADAWEKSVIDGKFLKQGWKKGQSFSQMTQHKGKKAFRLISPEYFKKGCMGCHGGENGAKIHASKMPGLQGQLGGAISVSIYK